MTQSEKNPTRVQRARTLVLEYKRMLQEGGEPDFDTVVDLIADLCHMMKEDGLSDETVDKGLMQALQHCQYERDPANKDEAA